MTRYFLLLETRIVLRTMLSAGVLAVLLLACAGAAAGATWVVDDDGGAGVDYTTIQAAVDAASAGDTIEVRSGTYVENVDVNKTLTLVGEGADVVTVRAADAADHVFEVTADWVNISGFTATGVVDVTYYYIAGIRLNSAEHCNITSNICSNNYYGIYLYSSSNNNALTNNAVSNNRDGIYLCYSSNHNTLANNTANSNNKNGIYPRSSSNNTLQNNTANSNGADGIYMGSSSNNTLQNNTANSNDADGIDLDRSSNNTLTSNTANSNNYHHGINYRHGIYLYYSSNNNTLTNNIANSNNYYGIYLWFSSHNIIACSLVKNNAQNGIHLYDESTDNNISYNNIIENGNYNKTSGGWEWQFYNNQPDAVEAKHNYWGAGMNNSTIDASIYDDEEGQGEVTFYPFETGPIPCAPTPERPAFTTTDAAIALQIAAGSRPFDSRWDVSGDGQVTSLDALMIMQPAAGRIEL